MMQSHGTQRLPCTLAQACSMQDGEGDPCGDRAPACANRAGRVRNSYAVSVAGCACRLSDGDAARAGLSLARPWLRPRTHHGVCMGERPQEMHMATIPMTTNINLDPARFFLLYQVQGTATPNYQVLPTTTGMSPFNTEVTPFLLPRRWKSSVDKSRQPPRPRALPSTGDSISASSGGIRR